MIDDSNSLIDSLFEESCKKFNLEFDNDFVKSIAKVLFAVAVCQSFFKSLSEARSYLEAKK